MNAQFIGDERFDGLDLHVTVKLEDVTVPVVITDEALTDTSRAHEASDRDRAEGLHGFEAAHCTSR